MAEVTSTVTSTLKPSTTTAWAIVVYGPWAWTSAHCHQARPKAVSEMTTVETVATRRRTAGVTSDSTAEEEHRARRA